MEKETLFTATGIVGIIFLFIFWFFVGVFAPESKSASVFSVIKEKIFNGLEIAGFAWFAANLVLPIFQGWLIPIEWVSYSSIFWWISFVGGVSGLFAMAIAKKQKSSKNKTRRGK